MRLKGKKIILGITGSIAAYKAAILIRLLVREGAVVKVVVTPYAKEFITPVTLATLSKNTVLSDFFSYDDGSWNSHVELGTWADLMLIAPITANTIAKMANGICDNLLLTTYLSVRCPVMIAPAMDYDMFRHPATMKNMETLRSFGNIVIEPSSGELASGLHGKGRMEDPEKIVQKVIDFLDKTESSKKKKLEGKRFLVTAGPTHEDIDPVRFIGNHSSGKMGYAIAQCLANNGAEVLLVSGPVTVIPSLHHIELVKVRSASEMYEACINAFPGCDGAILAAAVADFTPAKVSGKKIKRGSGRLHIDLEPTVDIAAELGRIKKKGQILAGFALETDNERENALRKIKNKNLDFIVLNSLRDEGSGFGVETNKVTIIDSEESWIDYELKPKTEVAEDIVNHLADFYR